MRPERVELGGGQGGAGRGEEVVALGDLGGRGGGAVGLLQRLTGAAVPGGLSRAALSGSQGGGGVERPEEALDVSQSAPEGDCLLDVTTRRR